jgi:hypothetical protein
MASTMSGFVEFHTTRRGCFRLAAALSMLACTDIVLMPAATAQTPTSVYTSTGAKDCRKGHSFKIDGDDYASERVCPGVGGLVVLWQEDDLRGTISVGRTAKTAAAEPAASQGFGAFNSTTDTIEWRLDGKRKPFAIIQRWHIADHENPAKDGRPGTKQTLVVTRLPPGPVCHVAHIEVKGNPNANEEARKVADEQARGFDCKESPGAKRDTSEK